MKYSLKGLPPASFVEWKALADDDWQPTYENFQNPQRKEVWDALLIEQEFVCCYCGRGLKDDRSDSHIDHFRPQKLYNGKTGNDLTLAYDNFVASCGPPKTKGMPSTCGDAKKSKFDETAYIAPWDPGCERRFSYGGSGTIQSATPADAAAANMIKDLKLNDRSLTEERRKILEAVEQAIARQEITADDVAAEITRWKTASGGRRFAFSQVAARYLEVEFDLG